LRLEVGLAEIVVDTHDLTGRLHLRTEHHVDAGELDEGEDGLLHGNVGQLALLDAGYLRDRVAEHGPRGHLRQRGADDLGDEGHRAGRARVDLQDIDRVVADGELDVDQPHHTQGLGEGFGLRTQGANLVLAQGVGGQRAGGVPGVDPGLLDVLHDPPDHHPLAVGHRIDIDLERVLQELVDEDRMLGSNGDRLPYVVGEILPIVHEPHGATAQHIGGADQHGVADAGGDGPSLLERARGGPRRLVEPELGEERAETLAVLRTVDGVG
jgi:hypothetical protein